MRRILIALLAVLAGSGILATAVNAGQNGLYEPADSNKQFLTAPIQAKTLADGTTLDCRPTYTNDPNFGGVSRCTQFTSTAYHVRWGFYSLANDTFTADSSWTDQITEPGGYSYVAHPCDFAGTQRNFFGAGPAQVTAYGPLAKGYVYRLHNGAVQAAGAIYSPLTGVCTGDTGSNWRLANKLNL